MCIAVGKVSFDDCDLFTNVVLDLFKFLTYFSSDRERENYNHKHLNLFRNDHVFQGIAEVDNENGLDDSEEEIAMGNKELVERTGT